MRVRVETYQVWCEDMEGRPSHSYLFHEVVDACAFAVANEGRIAYHLPSVIKIVTTYDTKDLSRHNIGECFYELSESQVRNYAEELR